MFAPLEKISAEFGAGEPLLKTRGRPGCNIEDSKAPRGTREGFQSPQASHLGAENGFPRYSWGVCWRQGGDVKEKEGGGGDEEWDGSGNGATFS